MILPMKITRDTPDQLIVDNTPWLLGIAISSSILVFAGIGVFLISQGNWAGLIFFVLGCCFGIAGFAAFVRRTQLILNRPANTATLRTRTLFGLTQTEHKLSNLIRAKLESTSSTKGTTLYRPTLILEGMSAGPHPIIPSYTNTKMPDEMVKAINGWLTASQSSGPS